jgi:hypothetical protein
MKTKIFILFALLFAFFSCDLYSQNAQSPGNNYNIIYDVNTVETVLGQVRSIDNIYSVNNTSYDIIMIIYTNKGDISVHLGPVSYLVDQVFKINTDDNVLLTGSMVAYEGSKVIVAKEVSKGDQVLKLRDDNGYPLWVGQSVK